jgi:hypothetical protein
METRDWRYYLKRSLDLIFPSNIPRRNKAVVLRMMEAFNTGNTKIISELIHPRLRTTTKHRLNPDMDKLPPGRLLEAEIMNRRGSFENGQFTVKKIVAEGSDVILFWEFKGTHTGAMFGKAATGRDVTVSGVEAVSLENGLIIGHTDNHDATLLDVLGQTGLINDPDIQGRLGWR